MAKITKKTIDKIFDDFKEGLFISVALDNNNVKPYDFYEYLKSNEIASKEYENIERYNNIYKEAQIEHKVFTTDFSKKILEEMVKANNKKKFTQKYEIEDVTPLSSLTDEDLDKKIKALQEKMDK